jgi:hypothetical protein
VLVIGVDDNAQLHPVELKGLKERTDQVARDRIDEPLDVRIEVISATSDSTKDYLLVLGSSAAVHELAA